jgi:hypothetical protein
MGAESVICGSEENGAEGGEKNLGLSISIQLILLFQHPPRTIAAKVKQSSLPINFKIRIRTYNRNDTDIQVRDRDIVATPVICAPLVRYLAARIWDSISTATEFLDLGNRIDGRGWLVLKERVPFHTPNVSLKIKPSRRGMERGQRVGRAGFL